MRYYRAVADCLAQCAAAFGGGTAAFGDYRLWDLLCYTHKAIMLYQSQDNDK